MSVHMFAVSFVCLAAAGAAPFELDVLPREDRVETDAVTGAQLLFLTRDGAADTNLYFHERSWSSDGSFIIFNSARDNGGLMGYIVGTGELFRIRSADGPVGGATCALNRPSVFALRGDAVLEFAIAISPSTDPGAPSQVVCTERLIATLPPSTGGTGLNENADGSKLAVGRTGSPTGSDPVIYVIDQTTGAISEACRIPPPQKFQWHVQWSHTSPNLLSFAGEFPRINVVDVDTQTISSPYDERRGELVTHEHWWVNDTIVFCGGTHPKPAEDAHVKVVDAKTGVTRILAPGSWWPGGDDEEIAKLNYWHCAGSDDGRWVVADNWHGDITLIEGKNARTVLLTAGHRTYGKGEHPHVGWDRVSKQVIFTSHRFGNPDVCVATIPDAAQAANSTPALTK